MMPKKKLKKNSRNNVSTKKIQNSKIKLVFKQRNIKREGYLEMNILKFFM